MISGSAQGAAPHGRGVKALSIVTECGADMAGELVRRQRAAAKTATA